MMTVDFKHFKTNPLADPAIPPPHLSHPTMQDKISGLEEEMKKIPNSKGYQKDLDECHEAKQELERKKAKQEGGLQHLKRQIREQVGRGAGSGSERR